MSALQQAGPGLSAVRRTRLTAPALTAAATLAAAALLHVRDPHVPGSYATCPWLYLTGMYCPGCGGLRAAHDLTHGDLLAAASSNLVVVAVLLPLAGAAWLAWARARWRGTRGPGPRLIRLVGWSLPVLLLAFGVVRNLPAAGWLTP